MLCISVCLLISCMWIICYGFCFDNCFCSPLIWCLVAVLRSARKGWIRVEQMERSCGRQINRGWFLSPRFSQRYLLTVEASYGVWHTAGCTIKFFQKVVKNVFNTFWTHSFGTSQYHRNVVTEPAVQILRTNFSMAEKIKISEMRIRQWTRVGSYRLSSALWLIWWKIFL